MDGLLCEFITSSLILPWTNPKFVGVGIGCWVWPTLWDWLRILAKGTPNGSLECVCTGPRVVKIGTCTCVFQYAHCCQGHQRRKRRTRRRRRRKIRRKTRRKRKKRKRRVAVAAAIATVIAAMMEESQKESSPKRRRRTRPCVILSHLLHRKLRGRFFCSCSQASDRFNSRVVSNFVSSRKLLFGPPNYDLEYLHKINMTTILYCIEYVHGFSLS